MVDDDTFILYFYFNIWMFSMMDDNDTIILHLYLDGYCRIILCVFVMWMMFKFIFRELNECLYWNVWEQRNI